MKRFILESLRDARMAVSGVLQLVGAWSMLYFYALSEDGLRAPAGIGTTPSPVRSDLPIPSEPMELGPHLLAPDSPIMAALLNGWTGGFHHFLAFTLTIGGMVLLFRGSLR